MDKYTEIYGVDISKDIFDIFSSTTGHAQFEDSEEDSKIEITLNEDEGETELTLTYTNVPESGEHYIRGWDEHYFKPMKAYFEFKE